ncbi:hypothetical protein EOL94_03415 [bacterium]|nr:hypothetical protein [bacterium]
MKIENKNINEEENKKNESLEEIKNNQESLEVNPENLESFANEVVEEIESSASDAVEKSVDDIKSSVEAIGGSEEDVEKGEEALKEVNEKIQESALKAKSSVEKINSPESVSQGEKMKDEYSKEDLEVLRAKQKEEYGEGLVNTFHKDARTLEEHEAAQTKAYEALQEKIDLGVVKPDSITSDMLNILDLREMPETSIEDESQIMGEVSKELDSFVEKGFVNQEERELIEAEAGNFLNIYKEAYPDADLDKILIVVKDNARKLAYQTERDKEVFSGSDHGTKHIIEGNINMADKMLKGLGDKITAKDKVLVHQIIIDHDMGYTVGIAQAKESFQASKDHPIFSARFVEDNKDYYIDKFGEDAYQAIKEGILQHSYVKSEYSTPTDKEKGFNFETIRSITSTVDALGVTAEIKCPAFFRQAEVIEVLQKIKLYNDTHEEGLTDKQMDKYKEKLHAIADKETNKKRQESFHNAIDNQFNSFTVDVTLGQYTGVLKDIEMVEKDGEVVPNIKMDISRAQALLGDFFGDKIALKAFKKAMEDFNVSDEVLEDMAEKITKLKETSSEEEKQKLLKSLKYSDGIASFEFSQDFSEGSSEVEEVFAKLEKTSIRGDINRVFRKLEKLEKTDFLGTTNLFTNFLNDIEEKAAAEDINKIIEIRKEIIGNLGNEEEFKNSLKELKNFKTKKEREFMEIE